MQPTRSSNETNSWGSEPALLDTGAPHNIKAGWQQQRHCRHHQQQQQQQQQCVCQLAKQAQSLTHSPGMLSCFLDIISPCFTPLPPGNTCAPHTPALATCNCCRMLLQSADTLKAGHYTITAPCLPALAMPHTCMHIHVCPVVVCCAMCMCA